MMIEVILLSIGCSLAQANKVFILPTPPKGEYLIDSNGHLNQPLVADIIAQDGNHWRKILTIMAKLSSSASDWRRYRETQLLQTSECILFHLPTFFDAGKTYFICGGQMQSGLAKGRELTALDEKGLIRVHSNLILCPYPDYRQFPNRLIDLNLTYLT